MYPALQAQLVRTWAPLADVLLFAGHALHAPTAPFAL
jgi:hypothetical protein